MDEFDKIRAFSRDIIGQENLASDESDENLESADEGNQSDEEIADEASKIRSENPENDGLSGLRAEYKERFGFAPMSIDFEEKKLFSMKWHIVAVSVFTGILLIVVAGFVFFGEDSSSSRELMTITASQNPIKIKPQDPGGIKIPDQEKKIYDRLKKDGVSAKVERLFPEPEKPVLPETLIQTPAPEAVAAVDVMEEAVRPVVAPAIKKAQEVSDIQPVAVKKEIISLPKEPVKKAVVSVPKNTQRAEKAVAPAEKGVWKAQLLSTSNKERVEKEWPVILSKNKALLSNMSYEIRPVQIQGRGTFYRLYVGQFKTREMADNLCQKLKANKQSCVPQK